MNKQVRAQEARSPDSNAKTTTNKQQVGGRAQRIRRRIIDEEDSGMVLFGRMRFSVGLNLDQLKKSESVETRKTTIALM